MKEAVAQAPDELLVVVARSEDEDPIVQQLLEGVSNPLEVIVRGQRSRQLVKDGPVQGLVDAVETHSRCCDEGEMKFGKSGNAKITN